MSNDEIVEKLAKGLNRETCPGKHELKGLDCIGDSNNCLPCWIGALSAILKEDK